MTAYPFPPPSAGGNGPGQPPAHPPSRLRRKRRRRRFDPERAIDALAIIVFLMAVVGLDALFADASPLGRFKVLIAALGLALVAWATNKTAIRILAPHVASGYVLAAVAGLFGILFVGAGSTTASITGMVFPGTAQHQIMERTEKHAHAIEQRVDRHRQLGKPTSVIEGIVRDQRALLECEIQSSCVSLVDKTGRGIVARQLEPMVKRGEALLSALQQGEQKARKAIAAVNATAAAYRDAIAKDDDVWARRREAAGIDARIRQELSAIEAYPSAAVDAFASELAAGFVIAGHPEASERLSRHLKGHAERLRGAAPSLSSVDLLPPFPDLPSVATAVGYAVTHYWPLAIAVAAIEIALPIILFVTAFIKRDFEIYQAVGNDDDDDHDVDVFGGRLHDHGHFNGQETLPFNAGPNPRIGR